MYVKKTIDLNAKDVQATNETHHKGAIWALFAGLVSNTFVLYICYVGLYDISGVLFQKQVSRAGTSNYIPQYLWDMITCPCPWYLFLA